MAGGGPAVTSAPLDVRAQAFRESFLIDTRAAAERHPVTVRDLCLAGTSVRLTIVDDGLAACLLPALAHHARAVTPPRLELIAWTDQSSPNGPHVFPWGPAHLGRRGAVRALFEGPVRSAAAHDGSSLVLWDAERQLASCWWRDLSALPVWEPGAPFRMALHFALSSPERRLIHAACVGDGSVGVLLAGPSGSGKSTTTEACLQAGLHSAGDDYVVLDTSGPAPRAHTLYRTVKTTNRLGERTAERDVRETRLVGEDVAGQMAASLRIGAVVVPHIVDQRASFLTEVPRARGLRALLPSTLFQVPQEPQADLSAIHRLASATPCYELSLGADRGVPAIAAALERLS